MVGVPERGASVNVLPFSCRKLDGLATWWSGTLLLDSLAMLAWLWWGRRRSLLPCAWAGGESLLPCQVTEGSVDLPDLVGDCLPALVAQGKTNGHKHPPRNALFCPFVWP